MNYKCKWRAPVLPTSQTCTKCTVQETRFFSMWKAVLQHSLEVCCSLGKAEKVNYRILFWFKIMDFINDPPNGNKNRTPHSSRLLSFRRGLDSDNTTGTYKVGALTPDFWSPNSEPEALDFQSPSGEMRASGWERAVWHLLLRLLGKDLAALIPSGNQLLSSARTLGYKLSVPNGIKMIDFNTSCPI